MGELNFIKFSLKSKPKMAKQEALSCQIIPRMRKNTTEVLNISKRDHPACLSYLKKVQSSILE